MHGIVMKERVCKSYCHTRNVFLLATTEVYFNQGYHIATHNVSVDFPEFSLTCLYPSSLKWQEAFPETSKRDLKYVGHKMSFEYDFFGCFFLFLCFYPFVSGFPSLRVTGSSTSTAGEPTRVAMTTRRLSAAREGMPGHKMPHYWTRGAFNNSAGHSVRPALPRPAARLPACHLSLDIAPGPA